MLLDVLQSGEVLSINSIYFNHEGKGPAWANSLFEDNAEFGYGMYLAVKHIRAKIAENMESLLAMNICDEEGATVFTTG